MMRELMVLFLLVVWNRQGHANEQFQPNNPTIIIIGSGASGIAAAAHLLKNNLTNIKILEAEPRIGGRINTVKFGKRNIDLGAEFCYGEDNIVHKLVKNLHLLAHYTGTARLVYSQGQWIETKFTKELFVLMAIIDQRARSKDLCDKSKGQFCEKKYNSSIYTEFKSHPAKLAIAREALEYYKLRSLVLEGGESLFNIALPNDFIVGNGDRRMNWKGRGFRILLEVLVRKYPNPGLELNFTDKILRNKEVTKIVWDAHSNGGAKVFCADESAYEAHHVIFTPSLGVLKKTHEQLFEPALPTKKQEAIRHIGVGTFMKIFSYYPDQWWHKNDEFHLIWSKNDIEAARYEFQEGPVLNGRSWVTYMSIILTDPYNPNVLQAWITGELVLILEYLPDELLEDGLQFVLNKFLGQFYNITEPETTISTKWNSDPHFRGAYSYQSIHSKTHEAGPSSQDDLAEPLTNSESTPIVQFAGEATHPTRYGTVDGAVEAGLREAAILVDIYRH